MRNLAVVIIGHLLTFHSVYSFTSDSWLDDAIDNDTDITSTSTVMDVTSMESVEIDVHKTLTTIKLIRYNKVYMLSSDEIVKRRKDIDNDNDVELINNILGQLFNQSINDHEVPSKRKLDIKIYINNVTFPNGTLEVSNIIPTSIAESGNVTALDLTMNSIEFIQNLTTTSKFSKSLKHLNISINFIELLNFTVFQNLTNLEELDLSWNLLKTILPGSLKKLKFLNLSENALRYIETDTFKGFRNLKILDLSGNKLEKIEHRSFKFLGKLTDLYLQRNPLQSLTLSFNCNNLKTLNLLENHLDRLKVYYDDECSREEDLKILGQLEEVKGTHIVEAELNSIALSNVGLDAILDRMDTRFYTLETQLRSLNNLTREMFKSSNEMMATIVWLRIANLCSAVIAASCIVPVLVIMCRARV